VLVQALVVVLAGVTFEAAAWAWFLEQKERLLLPEEQ
jgi:hypothetical protein